MNEQPGFDPLALGERMRDRLWIPESKSVLVSKIPQEELEGSTHAYINCDGYGIVRKSTTQRSEWPDIDILPGLVPSKLEIPPEEAEWTQIFRIAGCNLRCWYCFVDFRFLKGDPNLGSFFSAPQLMDKYQEEEFQPKTIYLTGGQPDLVPEWTVSMMEEMEKRELDKDHFLWQDDNLSTYALFDQLSEAQLDYIASFKNYARATCLKGISPESFYANTGASPRFFDTQIDILKKLVASGIDVYTYITLLSQSLDHAKTEIPQLMDRLRTEVHENMPLRVIPSKVVEFPQTTKRVGETEEEMLANQKALLEIWQDELGRRYNVDEISKPKHLIDLK